jgi:hypothetical protein
VKYCVDAGLEVIDTMVDVSVQRTLSEFNRVSQVEYYASHIPGFEEVLQKACDRGSFCCIFPFVTVVARNSFP